MCLNLIVATFNVLNNSPRGRYSLLKQMVGFDQGASSRGPHRTRNSCYNKETQGGGTRGRVCPCGLCLKSTLEYFNALNNTVKGCHSLLTWVLGLGQGASSRVLNLTRIPGTNGNRRLRDEGSCVP